MIDSPNSRIYTPNHAQRPEVLQESSRDEHTFSCDLGGEDEDVHAAESFPVETFPAGPTNEMVHAIRDYARVPDSLAGCCVLGALSASIGGGLQVNSLPTRVARANLAIVASGESGSGKSVAFDLALAPLQERQRELSEAWRVEAFPTLRADKNLLDAEIKQLNRAALKPMDDEARASLRSRLIEKERTLLQVEGRLHGPKLFTEDATVQALADVLARDPGECTASLSADAGEPINILLGRYNQTRRTDDSLYVKAWTGEPHSVDRKSTSYTLHRPCLSVLWLVQREKLDHLLGNRSLAEGGFVPRLLICHTDCRPQYIDRSQASVPAATTRGYRGLIRGLLETFRQRTSPATIDPTTEAMEAFDRYHDGVIDRRLGELDDVSSYAARWPEQAWRIGVCLHAAKWSSDACNHPMELPTAMNAIALAEWFANQQLRNLECSRDASRRDLQDKVRGMLVEKPEGITARDIYKALRMTAEKAALLLDQLEQEKKIVVEEIRPERGGHLVRRYKLRPA